MLLAEIKCYQREFSGGKMQPVCFVPPVLEMKEKWLELVQGGIFRMELYCTGDGNR